MRAIEHPGPRLSLLLSSSSDETALRASVPDTALAAPRFVPAALIKLALPLLEGFLQRFVANPMLQADAAHLALTRRVIEARCKELARALARRRSGRRRP